ncbi:hypothetical protein FA95DRAFT_372118 [Auriscalpium vulgare]|uniref:Uncharacterized protein n=1 Tax=Auriscalpium vulgare TaxID=40419 RepID=A0ACB8RHT4_9AGAM|nr:hypothetical protein FA95DRAFT_372118 [Auriscalpium vulgare]
MKAHPCFRGIDWAKVAARQIDAPWVPGQFDLFEEVRDAKAHGGTFQLVGGDNFSVDPFPFYTFTAPDFSMPRSPAPAVSATPALLSALSTPALSIASSASSGSGSSRLSPRLSGFFGRMRQVLTPQTSRSPVSSAESLPVPCEDATPDKPVEAEDASSVSTGPRRVSALRDECRAWLKGKLRLPKAKKGRA